MIVVSKKDHCVEARDVAAGIAEHPDVRSGVFDVDAQPGKGNDEEERKTDSEEGGEWSGDRERRVRADRNQEKREVQQGQRLLDVRGERELISEGQRPAEGDFEDGVHVPALSQTPRQEEPAPERLKLGIDCHVWVGGLVREPMMIPVGDSVAHGDEERHRRDERPDDDAHVPVSMKAQVDPLVADPTHEVRALLRREEQRRDRKNAEP